MALFESGEMYLETVLILSGKKQKVRSVDVADYMAVSKPSVSRAIGILQDEDYIVIDESGGLALTDSGRAIAERIYGRHTALSDMLVSIGVSPEQATADACKMEHDMSDETFEALKRHFGGK